MSQIHVKTNTFTNGTNFNPNNKKASSGGSITLTSNDRDALSVYTYQQTISRNWVEVNVFEGSCSPYSASTGNGNALTLRSGITGEIILSLSSTPPALSDGPLTGSNGMINVNTGDPE